MYKIKNLILNPNGCVIFDIVNGSISARVEVRTNDLKHGKAMVFVDEYKIDGKPYDSENSSHCLGIKRFAEKVLGDMAEDNNWILWSY